MPTNYTPLVDGADALAATFNAPLTELDDTIEDVVDGSKTLSTPTITSFTNATHDHEDAAGGGQITAAAIDSGASTDGQVLTSDGAGNAAWETFTGVPTGVILPYGGATAPTGYLLCDGSAVNRTTYATLFAIVSTSFGTGNGTTTFNVPDLRGRFPLGQDDMGGSSANRVTATEADTVGSASGAETHTLSITEIPSHNHGGVLGLSGSGSSQFAGGGASTSTAVSSQGGGGAHNNMPPYQTVNYIIKY